mgnify:CR=1 FL=1
MSAVPKKMNFSFLQKEPKEAKSVTKSFTQKPVGYSKNDFFIKEQEQNKQEPKNSNDSLSFENGDNSGKTNDSLSFENGDNSGKTKNSNDSLSFERMSVDIQQIMSQQDSKPAKKPRKKRAMTEARLAQLAKMRATRSENCRLKREAKAKGKTNAPVSSNVAPSNVASSNVASSSVAPSSVSKASTESKEQKRARKKAETKQYFEEFYGEKEKVRVANKAKRKQEKEETYKKLVADGVISYNTKPKAKPKPYVAPVPTGRKKMRQCADGSIEIYFET